jgi:hypothetical protein
MHRVVMSFCYLILESHVIPILFYGCPYLNYSRQQVGLLRDGIRFVVYFSDLKKWESVEMLIYCLGCLKSKHLILWREACFLQQVSYPRFIAWQRGKGNLITVHTENPKL